jgi:hypothetical protein
MPFLSKDLSVLAYANNFTLWHYTTPDIQTVVTTAGYFNNTALMVRVNYVIHQFSPKEFQVILQARVQMLLFVTMSKFQKPVIRFKSVKNYA